ncbi:hypothetical protein M5C96_02350 [Acidovorax sp. GBBC 1281]|uniref:hypothetical protein n=1 Tax=Acidovorax sp. GBBC 1281 TaxID=2940492 RepID=UPI002349036F|nr:hypothetical protein [Acidovorax sp. GBBC 1281]WCM98327.1 hypothetical protein M5C96_02350 [Acidovorax sp. GBBC 1281]
MRILFGNGEERGFQRAGAQQDWVGDQRSDTLAQADGLWRFRNASDDTVLTFDSAGKLLSRKARNGWVTTYGYTYGRLTTITNAFGKTLTLVWGDRLIEQIITPDYQTTTYRYSYQDGVGDRLVSSRLQDQYQKTYLYEDTGNPFLLTAIVDENGSRFAQFSYDALGRTLKAAHAGDALAHQFDYTDIASGQVGVKDPLVSCPVNSQAR